MERRPLFFRPITPGLTEEEEAAEVAEIIRVLEAARDAAAAATEVAENMADAPTVGGDETAT